mmetsp:Transcript_24043/g.56738  ORF Transcript_24043/g.56738 Transcript_24043/m.56738 type:complete len:212 (+) Transcript_24043:106-741(+)
MFEILNTPPTVLGHTSSALPPARDTEREGCENGHINFVDGTERIQELDDDSSSSAKNQTMETASDASDLHHPNAIEAENDDQDMRIAFSTPSTRTTTMMPRAMPDPRRNGTPAPSSSSFSFRPRRPRTLSPTEVSDEDDDDERPLPSFPLESTGAASDWIEVGRPSRELSRLPLPGPIRLAPRTRRKAGGDRPSRLSPDRDRHHRADTGSC